MRSTGRVLVRGNRKTRAEVVEHEMKIEPDQWLVANNIAADQQRLYRVGYFSSVEMRQLKANREGTLRNIVVEIREDDNIAVEPSAGYGTADGLRGEPCRVLEDPLAQEYGEFGTHVAPAGDPNGDGLADIIEATPLDIGKI